MSRARMPEADDFRAAVVEALRSFPDGADSWEVGDKLSSEGRVTNNGRGRQHIMRVFTALEKEGKLYFTGWLGSYWWKDPRGPGRGDEWFPWGGNRTMAQVRLTEGET